MRLKVQLNVTKEAKKMHEESKDSEDHDYFYFGKQHIYIFCYLFLPCNLGNIIRVLAVCR